jgi:crotonobetainyl-CoA:carnitine CoA-transferase CaiB-like acyl-CoA transferase
MSINGEPDGPPLKTGVAFADIFAGKDAAIATLAALTAAARGAVLPVTQRRINISLAHSATSALINVAQNALITGVDPQRHGNSHPNLVPYKLFETADQPIVIAVGNDSQWRMCLQALGGLEDLEADASLATNAGRVLQRDRVVSRIQDRLTEGGADVWMEALGRAGVPCGRLRTVLESLQSVSASKLTGIAPSAGGSVRLPPPGLDEHAAQIRAHKWGAFQCAESHDSPEGKSGETGERKPVTAP